MNYKISVIVPVYNTEDYLGICIESIIKQTYSNLELILINDGSTDKSSDIAEEYALKDSRIKIIHKVNEGAAIARKLGFEIANGEYVACIDSDDYVQIDMLQILINKAVEEDADIVQCGYNTVDVNHKILKTYSEHSNWALETEYEVVKCFFKSNGKITPSLANKLIRKNLFEGIFIPQLFQNEDIVILIQILYKTNKFYFVKDVLYYYVQTPISITRSAFSLKKLDAIKAQKLIFKVNEKKYTEFCDYQSRNILFTIPRMYYYVNKSNFNNKKELMYELVSDFTFHLKRINISSLKDFRLGENMLIVLFVINKPISNFCFGLAKNIRKIYTYFKLYLRGN